MFIVFSFYLIIKIVLKCSRCCQLYMHAYSTNPFRSGNNRQYRHHPFVPRTNAPFSFFCSLSKQHEYLLMKPFPLHFLYHFIIFLVGKCPYTLHPSHPMGRGWKEKLIHSASLERIIVNLMLITKNLCNKFHEKWVGTKQRSQACSKSFYLQPFHRRQF